MCGLVEMPWPTDTLLQVELAEATDHWLTGVAEEEAQQVARDTARRAMQQALAVEVELLPQVARLALLEVQRAHRA